MLNLQVRFFLILIIMPLLLPAGCFVSAQGDYESIGGCSFDMNINGTILISEYSDRTGIESLHIRLIMPPSNNMQKSLYPPKCESDYECVIEEDIYGNEYILINFTGIVQGYKTGSTSNKTNKSSARQLNFKLNFHVIRDGFNYTIAGTGVYEGTDIEIYNLYTQPEKLNMWNEQIREIAQNLSDMESNPPVRNDLAAAARISDWVHNNLEYDSSLGGDISRSAIWACENRRGTCDEFTELFVAMCKSVGIPARRVSGLIVPRQYWKQGTVKINDITRLQHAWAQVYIGGEWIPVDPTYNQFGFVDGGHIALNYPYNMSASRLKADWKSYGVDVEIKDTTDITVEVVPQPVVIEIIPRDLEAFHGDVVNFTVILKNLRNTYLAGPCEIYFPENLKLVEESRKQQLFYLEPQGESEIIWKFKIPDAPLDYKRIYPVIIKTFPDANATSEIRASGYVDVPKVGSVPVSSLNLYLLYAVAALSLVLVLLFARFVFSRL